MNKMRGFTVYLILFGFLLVFPTVIYGQAPDIQWINYYDGRGGRSVSPTSDGGYIIVGAIYEGGYSDFFIIKTDSYGDTLWTRTCGGADDDRPYSVQQTTDGGYIIAGYTGSFGNGSNDIYLVRMNTAGDTLWTKAIGGGLSDWGSSVIQTSDSGFVIVGSTLSFGAGETDVYLVKTDSNGDTLWTRTIGGIDRESGNSVIQTPDDGYVIVGTTWSFGAGESDVYLIKTDSQGDTIWTRTYGGVYSEYGSSIDMTSGDNGFAICGTNHTEAYLIRTNSEGDTLWTKTYGRQNRAFYGYSVKETMDGGYIISGESWRIRPPSPPYSQLLVIRTDSFGDTLWTSEIGGDEFNAGYSVCQATDGGYVISGETLNIDYPSYLLLVKFASDQTGVNVTDNIPDKFNLKQNYPNPFNASTTISFTLPQESEVTISIYNILGQKIASVFEDMLSAGENNVVWNASEQSSGMYFYKIQAGDYTETMKMLLLK
jgi:hypothetical protein